MPRKLNTPFPNPLSPALQSHPPSKNSTVQYKTQLTDWSDKNARAKAIIMSTLIPGSEPWQIAESLEYAADIWKALEQKYGPKEGTEAPQAFVEKWIDKGLGNGGDPDDKGADMLDEEGENEKTTRQRTEAFVTGQNDTRAAKQQEARVTESTRCEAEQDYALRDQRFLWALLNGGKEYEVDQYITQGQAASG